MLSGRSWVFSVRQWSRASLRPSLAVISMRHKSFAIARSSWAHGDHVPGGFELVFDQQSILGRMSMMTDAFEDDNAFVSRRSERIATFVIHVRNLD